MVGGGTRTGLAGERGQELRELQPYADHPQPSLFQIMDEIERRIIIDMLERTGWNQTEASERFMIPLSTLNQKIKRLGIDVRRRGRADETLSASIGK